MQGEVRTMVEYRNARKSELKEIAKMVAETFGEYPMYTLTFRDKFASCDDFLRYITKLNRVHISSNARKHHCFVGVEGGEIVSVALLQDPRKKRITLLDYILSGGVRLLIPVGIRRLLDFFRLSNQARRECEAKHKDAWYIELLAVSSKHKGKGYGKDMISNCLIPFVKRQLGKEIALITNTETNCRFYEKNGFMKFSQSELNWNGEEIMNFSFVRAI